eukprot:Tbor_TRINITY_DN4739_c0_g1::TRINITY_DN4739_c0_g1_i1::g.17064::m.17064/K12825/SF3A1, SAP114; splicing factor 3A subunit 1
MTDHQTTVQPEDPHSDITLPPPKTETILIKIAIGLAQKDPSRFDDLRLKLVNKGVVGLDCDHPYYTFFYSKYKEFRDNPSALALATAIVNAGKGDPVRAAEAAEVSAKSNRERQEEAVKGLQQKMLFEAEADAKRIRLEPHPKAYQLVIEPGVNINRVTFDTMSLTAQYAAKCSCLASSRRNNNNNSGVERDGMEAFLNDVKERYANTNVFRFLNDTNPLYKTFIGLVSSYEKILNFDCERVQKRLEPYEAGGAQFERILDEKRDYYKAEAARRRATLLTEGELKKRLNWSCFSVVGTFTLQDLGFGGVGVDVGGKMNKI